MIGLQYSVHQPSPFIDRHRASLLPDWQVSVQSVMVILQPCSVALNEVTPITEQQKRQLRRRFLYWAKQLIVVLHQEGYAADGFDPRTGHPYYSRAGSLTLDDVAVVQSVLGYPLVPSGDCRLVEHPIWGCGVFPSVIVSSAPCSVLEDTAQRLWHSTKRSGRLKAPVLAFANGRG
ncbi:methylmalonic aciduria and homocystinuria type D protein [Altericista sp. CCNU0014]|uniref:methylmalonic aciduria and homocystinuria type D protein n=1 Tax=Altericista sp. CCNU0014 TaxID=3082949 RepID=UPI00384DDA90